MASIHDELPNVPRFAKQRLMGLRSAGPNGPCEVYQANPDWTKGKHLRTEIPRPITDRFDPVRSRYY